MKKYVGGKFFHSISKAIRLKFYREHGTLLYIQCWQEDSISWLETTSIAGTPKCNNSDNLCSFVSLFVQSMLAKLSPLDFPVMGCPRSTWNTLIISRFKLLVIPQFNKIWEKFASRLWRKIRKIHILLIFQPGSKLIILWEIVFLGQFLNFGSLNQQK